MKKIYYLIALLSLLLSGCEKDNSLAVVEISTGESSNVTTNGATVSLTCNDATGLAYVGVMYSRETTFEDASTVDLNTKTSFGGTFDFSLTGLMSGVTYYYKGYAMDGRNNRIYGIVKTFITESQSLSLSESMISVIGGGETKQIQVTSNGAWTAASNQDWCKVLTVSGSDNGSMSFIVSKNDGTAERSAVITVKCGALSQTLTVVQQASSASLSVSTGSFSPASGSGIYKFTVTSNTAWTVTCDQSWCTVTPVVGTGNAEVSFNVTANTSTTQRTANIVIIAGGASQTIIVTQQGASSSLAVSSNNFTANASGESKSFTVTSNTNWTVTSNQSWCTVTPSTSSNNGTVTFTASANTNTTQRTAIITVSTGTSAQQITVVQDAKAETPTLNVSSTNFSLAATANSNTFTITSNQNWTVSSNQNWCTVTPASGDGNGTVTFSVTENTATTQRAATITVKTTTGNITQTITVTQAGATAVAPTLSVSSTNFSVAATSGSNTFTITSNQSWTVSSNQSWCTVSPNSGSNSGTVTFSITENTATTARTATITVTAGSETKTITVTQAAAAATLSVSTNSFALLVSGGSNKFTVTSNANWTVSSNQTWCVVSPQSGSNTGEVTFTASANTSADSRTATITITAGEHTEHITVTQVGTSAPTQTLSVSSTSFSLAATNSSNTFTVTSNQSWTVTSNQSWCTVSPVSGSNNGIVTFGLAANTTTYSRTATITVSAGSTTQNITIAQAAAASTLSVSTGNFAMIAAAGNNTFTVTSNTNWTVSSNQTWCTVSPASGSNTGTVAFSITANTAAESRSAVITIKAGTLTQQVAVSQLGASAVTPTLSVSSTSFSVAATANSNTFTITSNSNWTVASNQSWCTVSSASGSNNGTVTFSVAANPAAVSRTATITVTAGSSSQQISITQAALSAILSISSTNFIMGATAGTNTFSITSNTNWTVVSNQSWCTVLPASGSNNGTVTFSIVANTTTAPRTATITVTAGTATVSVSVVQQSVVEMDPYITINLNVIPWIKVSSDNEISLNSAAAMQSKASGKIGDEIIVRSGSSSTVEPTGVEKNIQDAVVYIYKWDHVNVDPECFCYISNLNSNSITMKGVKTGSKKIFVAVNTGGSRPVVYNNNATPSPSDASATNCYNGNSLSNSFTNINHVLGSTSTGFNVFNNTWPVNGTEGGSQGLIKTLAGGAFNTSSGKLYSTDYGNGYYFMTNWDGPDIKTINNDTYASTCLFTIKDAISASQSQVEGGDNYFKINIQHAVAKVSVRVTANGYSTNTSSGYVGPYESSEEDGAKGRFIPWQANGKPVWSLGNINKHVYPFQSYIDNAVASPNYAENNDVINYTNPASSNGWYENYDNTRIFGTGKKYMTDNNTVDNMKVFMLMSGNSLAVSDASGNDYNSNYAFCTENGTSFPQIHDKGTFAMIAGEYRPKNWISSIKRAIITSNPPSIGWNGASVSEYSLPGQQTYGTTYTVPSYTNIDEEYLYYINPDKIFIHGKKNLFAYYAYSKQYDMSCDESNLYHSFYITDMINKGLDNGNIVAYYKGQCCYKVFINDPTINTSNEYNVLRNYIYDVNLSNIKGPGLSMSKHPIITQVPILDIDSYATIEINVLDWHFVQQRGDIDNRSAQISKQDRKTIQTTIRSGSRDVVASTAETSLGSVGVYIYKSDASGSVPECAVYLSTGSFVSSGPNAGKFVATMKITSGQKKIFVACNIVDNAAGADLVNHSGLGAVGSDIPYSFTLNNTLYSTGTVFGKGSITSLVPKVRADGLIRNLAMNDLYGTGAGMYTGSVYSRPLMTNWDGPDDMDNAGGTATTFESTASFRLYPDIDSISSQNQLASLGSNYVVINVQRAYAKISFKFDNTLKTAGTPPATPPLGLSTQAYKAAVGLNSEGRFFPWGSGANAYWSLGNIPTAELPFQGFDATSGIYVRDPFYRETNDSVSNPAHFTAWTQHYDNNRVFPMASLFSYPNRNLTVTGVKMTMLTAGNYTNMTDGAAGVGAYNFAYCTENARKHPVSIDHQTYAIVGGFYQPKIVTTNIIRKAVPTNGVEYVQSTNFTWVPTGVPTDSLYYISDDMVFVYGRKALLAYYAWVQQKDINAGGTPGGTIDAQTLTDAAYTADLDVNGISDVIDAINRDIDNGILYAYFQGQCWYRVYLYDDAENNTSKKVSVLRNHIYDVTINSIKGPGIADPNKIIPISKIIYL